MKYYFLNKAKMNSFSFNKSIQMKSSVWILKGSFGIRRLLDAFFNNVLGVSLFLWISMRSFNNLRYKWVFQLLYEDNLTIWTFHIKWWGHYCKYRNTGLLQNISSLYQKISSLDHNSSSLEDETSSVSLNAIHRSHVGRPVGHRSGKFIGDSLLILSHCNILADEGTILVKSTWKN